jgi:hypothetical protein
VWTSHNLVVELNDKTFWFWDAPQDAHGTTQNSLALLNPERYQTLLNDPKYMHKAQWTRVFVMPHSVVAAAQRENRKEAESMVFPYIFFSCYV